jgi:predicted ATPase/DNA-binding SARP family transcriptional activator
LEVVDDDGAPVEIPGTRLRMLLAVLLVHANEVVPVDRLSDALWGDRPPAGLTNALQKLVSNLRRSIPDRVTWTGSGYRFECTSEELDISRFEALLAKDAPHDALALWRGPALAEFAEEEFARGEAVRLEEMRVVAIEDGIDARLDAGHGADLVGELQALIVEYPLRERLRRQLMLALYRAGRQADALRAYQDARDTLVDELGIEPGPELRDLETAILEQDPALAAPAPATPDRPRTNLRAPLTSLVGRARELDAVTELLRTSRIVTLVGPGGSGKTRLAVEVASRAGPATRNGAWLVELAPIGSGAELPRAITDALGLADGMGLGQINPPDLLDRLVEFLQPKELLLVLDNCEHVVTDAARLVVDLAERCPGLRILATSREGLGAPGEHLFAVPPLPIDDALELFAQRAAALDDFSLDDASRPTATEICNRLDGLPLAIELAAARTRVLSLDDISERLDQRFRLLTGGPRTALPRQQTLRAVVDWSYDLLFDDERRVFERLSVFADGCDLAGAEYVCSGDDIPVEDIADIVVRLVEKSLVTATRVDGLPRFTMLQTLVQYGREHLAATGDADRVRRRHAEYVATITGRGPAAFRGEGQDVWLDDIRREHGNIVAALEWAIEHGDAELACDIAGSVGWGWWMSGQAREGAHALERALALPGPTTDETRARALVWRAWLAGVAGEEIDYLAGADEIVRLLRSGDDRDLHQFGVFAIAERLQQRGHVEAAAPLYEESMAIAQDHGWFRARNLYIEGRLAAIGDEPLRAEELFLASVDIAIGNGDRFGAMLVLSQVGEVAAVRGDLQTAREAWARGRDLAEGLGLRGAVASFDIRMMTITLDAGDYDGAAARLITLLEEGREVAIPSVTAHACAGIALIARLNGDLETAEARAREALQIFRAASMYAGEALALISLGFIAEAGGRTEQAAERFGEALRLAQLTANAAFTARSLEGLAAVALQRADAERAAALLGHAAALRDATGTHPVGPDRDDLDRITAGARDALAAGFDGHFARGAQADLDALTS